MTKKAEKAAQVAANKLRAFNTRVSTLTGHVAGRIPADERTAAFTAGKSAEEFAAEVATREPVGAALFADKAVAVEYAAEEARKEIAKIRDDLIAHGWDINAAAPRPGRDIRYTPKGEKMAAKNNEYSYVTTSDPAKGYQRSGMNNEPYFVVMADEAVARYVERAARDAALYYDKFIVKMVAKVGPCLEARIEGSHVWSYSILTVVLPGQPVRYQRWKTQQIVNYSVYGRAYLQWPSRIVK